MKITPTVTVARIAFRLHTNSEGCRATVRYSHTSLDPAGDAFLEKFTETYFQKFMQTMEARLNHYLTTGECLRG